MEAYFKNPDGSNNGGMMCGDGNADTKMGKVFRTMDAIYRNSMEAIGGKYVKQEDELTCAIGLAPTRFFEVRARDR